MKILLLGLIPLCAVAATRSIPVGPNPESVTRGFGGDLFVTLMGETRKDGDGNGRIVRVAGESVSVFATGLDDPKGIVFSGEHLITADFTRVWKIDSAGQKILLAGPSDFPHPPAYLNDVALSPDGRSILVTDMGAVTKMRNPEGQLWPVDSVEAKAIPVIARVYRITLDGQVSVALDATPVMLLPNGVSAPDADTLLIAEFFTGNIYEYSQGQRQLLASGHRGADAVERDTDGTLYVSEVITGHVWAITPGGKKVLLTDRLTSAADFYLDLDLRQLVVPDTKAGTIVFLPLPASP